MKIKHDISLASNKEDQNLKTNKLDLDNFIKKISFFLNPKINEIKMDTEDISELGLMHIDDFMALNNEQFTEKAYLVLLKRLPDPEGKRSRLEELNSLNKTRLDVLDELLDSEEAKNYEKPTILGMNQESDQPIKSFNIANIIDKKNLLEEEFFKLIEFFNYISKNYIQLEDYFVYDLLEFENSYFIFQVYNLILKRNPDYEGFFNYLKLFDNSKEYKLTIIHSVCTSDEYKQNDINVLDFNMIDIGKYENKSEIMLDLRENFLEINHILFSRSKMQLQSTQNLESLIKNNNLDFLYLILELLAVPFENRSELFQKYIDKLINLEIDKISVAYEIVNDVISDIVLIDFFGKDIIKNNSENNLTMNLVYNKIKSENDKIKNIDEFLEFTSNMQMKEKYNSTGCEKDIHVISNYINKLPKQEEIDQIHLFNTQLIQHINFLSELLIEHENKLNKQENK